MINSIKKYLLGFAAMGLLLVPLAAPVAVHAQLTDCGSIKDCADRGAVEADPDGDTAPPEERVTRIISQVIDIFSVIVGVVAVIMIIVGGLKYITSGGDSGNVTGAKNTILYAVVGLIVVAFAQVLVRFVLNRATES